MKEAASYQRKIKSVLAAKNAVGFVFDALFMWAQGPAKIWATLASFAQVAGLC